ncbi:MAG: 6,7-dimethyl-8-ribityllumazine synthase [Pseudomonadota bacterium]|nr:6,7-dimethyl-8-ribityllumazine synthase [Pseudomonadota bacterium]
MNRNILIVEARFYDALADALVEGAVHVLEEEGCQYERAQVPGVLEIPVAIACAARTGKYDGYVALGVVIRGETTHYDIVCGESARGLMDLGVRDGLAIGNGIQTVENEQQAWARCNRSDKDKGGGAAKAALALLGLGDEWQI